MVIVTGTKRSGTSLWMQIMKAGGFEIIGDAFPGIWGESIRGANPKGFYESRFRNGVFYRTNPHPETGVFMHPKAVRAHALKVFIPGLIRTDFAYIGPVISTMRDWRNYGGSLKRLYSMEDSFRLQAKAEGRTLGPEFLPDEKTVALIKAGRIPMALEWWFQNYALIRDMAIRRYRFYMTTYDRLLLDPNQEISKVFKWLGRGDVKAAVSEVDVGLQTQKKGEDCDDLVSDFAGLFDEFYGEVHRHQKLSASFIQKLNDTHIILSKRWSDVVEERQKVLGNSFSG